MFKCAYHETHVLLVDYPEIGHHLVPILENMFKCTVKMISADCELMEILTEKFDLILILDKTTGCNGFKIAKNIREFEAQALRPLTPIINLLSHKPSDKVDLSNLTDLLQYRVLSLSNLNLQDVLADCISEAASVLNDEDSDPLGGVDLTVLKKIIASLPKVDCDLVYESVELFLKEFSSNMRILSVSRLERDDVAFSNIVNQMEINARSFGATRLSELLFLLNANRADNEEVFQSRVNQINICLLRTKYILMSHVKSYMHETTLGLLNESQNFDIHA